MKDFVIVGAGGFAREVAWLAEDLGLADRLLGFVAGQADQPLPYPLLGDDAWAWAHLPPATGFVVAVGQSALRRAIALRYEARGFGACSLVHPSVRRSSRVAIGSGAIICAGTTLTTDIAVGRHVVINLHCTVGHDCQIGDYATLSPGVHLSGGVQIGTAAELGTGAVVLPGISLGAACRLGAGAVATTDLVGEGTYVGVPARRIG